MDDKTHELINALSTKMGVASSQVWEVLVSTAYVQGILQIINFVVLLVITIVVIGITYKNISSKNEHNWGEDKHVLSVIFSIILATVTLVYSAWGVEGVGLVVSPEYGAIKMIAEFVSVVKWWLKTLDQQGKKTKLII